LHLAVPELSQGGSSYARGVRVWRREDDRGVMLNVGEGDARLSLDATRPEPIGFAHPGRPGIS
jgi:hypothetical protein